MQRASAATILGWVPFEMQLGEVTVTVTVKGLGVDSQIPVSPHSDSQLTVIKETCDEILGRLDSLVTVHAKTGVVTGAALPRKPKPEASPYSREAQASMKAVPNLSPMGRMYAEQNE